MPIPRAVARFNRIITNPISRLFAGRIAPFALLQHRGRTSGRIFSTPIAVFSDGAEFVLALTYGREADWVRNVMTAGGCSIEYRRRTIELTDPRLSSGSPDDQPLPGIVRTILKAIGATEFLRLRRKDEPETGGPPARQ